MVVLCVCPTGVFPAWICALQQPAAQSGLRKRAHLQPERQQRAHGHTGPHDHVPPPLTGGVQPQAGVLNTSSIKTTHHR